MPIEQRETSINPMQVAIHMKMPKDTPRSFGIGAGLVEGMIVLGAGGVAPSLEFVAGLW